MKTVRFALRESFLQEIKNLAQQASESLEQFIITSLAQRVHQLDKDLPKVDLISMVKPRTSVTVVNRYGVNVIISEDDRAISMLFIPFDEYPALKKASVEQIYAVERFGHNFLRWPGLNLTISLQRFENHI